MFKSKFESHFLYGSLFQGLDVLPNAVFEEIPESGFPEDFFTRLRIEEMCPTIEINNTTITSFFEEEDKLRQLELKHQEELERVRQELKDKYETEIEELKQKNKAEVEAVKSRVKFVAKICDSSPTGAGGSSGNLNGVPLEIVSFIICFVLQSAIK